MSLLQGAGLKVLAGVAIVGAIIAVLAGARSAGRNAERVDGMRRSLDAVRESNEIEDYISRAGNTVVRDQLRDKWTRD